MRSSTSSPSPRSRGFVEVRDAEVSDAAVIGDIHHLSRAAALRDIVPAELVDVMTREERRGRWVGWLTDPLWLTMVAEREGRALGFCTVGPSRDRDVDPVVVAEIPTLYVLPSHWRRGIGRLLCAAAVSRAAEMGYRELSLWTLEANRNARRFYESFGFIPDGTSKTDDDPVPSGLLVMRLRIGLKPDTFDP